MSLTALTLYFCLGAAGAPDQCISVGVRGGFDTAGECGSLAPEIGEHWVHDHPEAAGLELVGWRCAAMAPEQR